MLKIQIRVKHVDLFAFCGREQHPAAEDLGQTGIVIGMGVERQAEEPEDEDLSRNGEGPDSDGPCDLQLLVCKLANGRTVELLGHEVELLTASHDGDLGYSEVL